MQVRKITTGRIVTVERKHKPRKGGRTLGVFLGDAKADKYITDNKHTVVV